MIRKSTFSPTDTAILAAFCMFLSLIEYMIPKPLPFLRLGLAHLPVIISLMIFTPRQTLLLTLLKLLGQGLVNGSLFSYIFLFSSAGSLTSTLVMLAVYRLLSSKISLVGVSIAGATASNLVQIMLARLFIFGEAALLIAPVFLTIGIISSILLGLFATSFVNQSEWINSRTTGNTAAPASAPEVAVEQAGDLRSGSLSRFTFICGLISVPAFVPQQNTVIIASEALFFIILSVIQGKRFRLLPNLIMAAGIISANLLTAHGRVLLEAGRFSITAGALETGATKAAAIIGLIYISRLSVQKELRLPGRLGSLLSLVFFYFERLTGGERINRKNVMAQLDQRLMELSAVDDKKNPEPDSNRTGLVYIIALIPPIIAWLSFAAVIILKL
ncbi:MAG TPA: hypothetical protein DCO79_02280 [Spirochaeta sp.]|nr:hypothetical protein [Spirochaeta sp.]